MKESNNRNSSEKEEGSVEFTWNYLKGKISIKATNKFAWGVLGIAFALILKNP